MSPKLTTGLLSEPSLVLTLKSRTVTFSLQFLDLLVFVKLGEINGNGTPFPVPRVKEYLGKKKAESGLIGFSSTSLSVKRKVALAGVLGHGHHALAAEHAGGMLPCPWFLCGT